MTTAGSTPTREGHIDISTEDGEVFTLVHIKSGRSWKPFTMTKDQVKAFEGVLNWVRKG